MFSYPLNFKFKTLALGAKVTVTDSTNKQLFFVKQKLFKLKENIQIFTDESMAQLVGTIGANKILDFSPRYSFKTPDGSEIGAVKRYGGKSLFRATYEVLNGDVSEFIIREEKSWVKFVDALIGEIPILGMFAGYIFNPVYIVQRGNKETLRTDPLVMKIKKQPAMFEGKFIVELLDTNLDEGEESRLVIGALTTMIFERFRG
ncbi:MAG: hypothetical protein IPP08_09210 [Chlorobiota bacterium]|jgi:hypothetical protein|nr:hypothetical protein [Chlorobiota bacterium]QQS65945.1 MAG: hypothetical protein IPP08_09210 [Chlorobiota bacterium]